MKKLVAILCATAMVASTAVVAFGSEITSPVGPFAPDPTVVDEGGEDNGTGTGTGTGTSDAGAGTGAQTPGGSSTTGGAAGGATPAGGAAAQPAATPLGGALVDADGNPIGTVGQGTSAADFSAIPSDVTYAPVSIATNGTDQAVLDAILPDIQQGAAIIVVEAKASDFGEKVLDENGNEDRSKESDGFILVDLLSDAAAHTSAEVFEALGLSGEVAVKGSDNKIDLSNCGIISLGYSIKLLVGGELKPLPEGEVTLSFPGSQLTKGTPKNSIFGMSTKKADENGNKQAPEFSPAEVSDTNVITATLNAAQPFVLIKDSSVKAEEAAAEA